MSHAIEIVNGVAQMAYAGETPWHGLGKRVPADLTPEQFRIEAGCDWEVAKGKPIQVTVPGSQKKYRMSRVPLYRVTDGKVLDEVPHTWNPVQNKTAFDFFCRYVEEGSMEMHTAGSLHDGEIIWAMAKIKDGFSLFGGDDIESYMLFTNPHRYMTSTSISLTPVRVVCQNTLNFSLNTTKSDKIVRHSHRTEFTQEVADLAMEQLGMAQKKIQEYKERAQFLGSKKAKDEDIVTYFQRIFPHIRNSRGTELSKNGQLAKDILETQPGANFAKGTWWQPFNAATFLFDHHVGKTQEGRLESAWFGQNAQKKMKALNVALELAKAA